MQRRIVLVSGSPGSGKTSLAVPLAAYLDFPLLSKDVLKEALWDSLAVPEGDLAWSRRVGGAAMDALWALAAWCPAAVLEANFRPHSATQRARLTALEATIVEVFCWCTPEVTGRRYAERAPYRHPAHVLSTLSAEALSEYDGPMGLGTVIRVDTRAPVDIGPLAREVMSGLKDSRTSPH